MLTLVIHFFQISNTWCNALERYETILGKKLIRTNFQRKMLSLDILERVEKKYTGGSHKAPYLYRLDVTKSEHFLQENF